jgi:MT0933-like antitoxin protein
MGISDRLKDLKTKATDAAAEHSDKLHEAVDKVATVADQRTGGKYSERIQKVGAKADGLVGSLASSDATAQGEGEQAPQEQAPQEQAPGEGEQSVPAPAPDPAPAAREGEGSASA